MIDIRGRQIAFDGISLLCRLKEMNRIAEDNIGEVRKISTDLSLENQVIEFSHCISETSSIKQMMRIKKFDSVKKKDC